MDRVAKRLWRWTARHPEWHPGEFGSEVASFAARAGDDLLLIDPLLPEDEDEAAKVLDTLDSKVRDRVAILISVPYHVRSSEQLWRRYRKDAKTRIYGHPAAAKRLDNTKAFREIEPGVPLPGGVTAHAIGNPRRHEMPLHLPSHDALVFGDAIAETGGRLAMWSSKKVDAKVDSFYRGRFAPTLEPLLELPFDTVLVTHGQPILGGGKEALRSALTSTPWYHHG